MGQLDVLWYDGDMLDVDGGEVGVLEETDEVTLAGLLQGHDGRALEAQIGLDVLRNLTNETLEGRLADEKLGALLVTTDLTESDCFRPLTVRFLDSSGGRYAFRAALVASCFLGTLPRVNLRAVCIVRAISFFLVFYQRRCEQESCVCKNLHFAWP